MSGIYIFGPMSDWNVHACSILSGYSYLSIYLSPTVYFVLLTVHFVCSRSFALIIYDSGSGFSALMCADTMTNSGAMNERMNEWWWSLATDNDQLNGTWCISLFDYGHHWSHCPATVFIICLYYICHHWMVMMVVYRLSLSLPIQHNIMNTMIGI